ncbi:MAG: 30S ribosome-binding factor RbfA [Candidatus Omnitrophica bacterium]|nr:30S ribosome-binding factor RbfA [Candidatus Omnitrophota bacterium]
MSRIERVNETVRREICVIVQQELGDPRLEFASITRVEVSRDLRHAKIYFSVLGDQNCIEQAENGFEAAKGLVRKLLSQRIRMKFMPELNFIYDKALEYTIHLDEEIERLKNESQKSS